MEGRRRGKEEEEEEEEGVVGGRKKKKRSKEGKKKKKKGDLFAPLLLFRLHFSFQIFSLSPQKTHVRGRIGARRVRVVEFLHVGRLGRRHAYQTKGNSTTDDGDLEVFFG